MNRGGCRETNSAVPPVIKAVFPFSLISVFILSYRSNSATEDTQEKRASVLPLTFHEWFFSDWNDDNSNGDKRYAGKLLCFWIRAKNCGDSPTKLALID
jgi:hypothetical protein